ARPRRPQAQAASPRHPGATPAAWAAGRWAPLRTRGRPARPRRRSVEVGPCAVDPPLVRPVRGLVRERSTACHVKAEVEPATALAPGELDLLELGVHAQRALL